MEKRVFVSHLACGELKEYLALRGYRVCEITDHPSLGKGVASHPDLVICKTPDTLIFSDGFPLAATYPKDAAFCAVFLENYLIHRLDISASKVLEYAQNHNITPINVRQGYTKCSTVVVDGNAVITCDKGIANALKNTDVTVLSVCEGHVLLPGFDTGFIGGASGRVDNEIIFNGDLSAHPDFEKICDFIRSRGLDVRYFPSHPLADIGSIIEE